jgi:hypothetical protein
MDANGLGRVTSLEQLEWMAQMAWEMLPDTCRRRVRIVRCDPEVRRYYEEEWACYRFTPETADVDLVIIDGPAPWTDDSGNISPGPNGDLAGLLPYLRPGCRVFVDGRLPTVAAIRWHMGHLFDIRQSRLNYTLMELKAPVSASGGLAG